jgi:hypothetical protein
MSYVLLLLSLFIYCFPEDETKNDFLDRFLSNGFDSVIDLAKALNDKYFELGFLASPDVEVSAEGSPTQGAKTISMEVFGEHYGEYDRSVAGVWFFYLYVNKRYKETNGKLESIATTLDEVIGNFTNYFGKDEDRKTEKIEALIISLVLNDIGKVEKIHNFVDPTIDHDAVLGIMLNDTGRYGIYVPSFVALNKNQQALIRDYFNAGMSVAQLAQAENVPGSTLKFVQLPAEKRKFGFWEAFFDVSGAAGHIQNYQSLSSVMGPFVMPTYAAVYSTLKTTSWDYAVQKGSDPKNEAIDFYWHMVEGVILYAKKIKNPFVDRPGLSFDKIYIKSRDNRSLQKKFCLSRLYLLARVSAIDSTVDVEAFDQIFDSLSQEDQNILIKGMSRDGMYDKTIMIYYAPALFTNLGKEGKKTALEILARLYDAGEKLLQTTKSQIVTIDIREIISPKVIGTNKEALKSGEFHFEVSGDIAHAKMGGDAGKSKTINNIDKSIKQLSGDLSIIGALSDISSIQVYRPRGG